MSSNLPAFSRSKLGILQLRLNLAIVFGYILLATAIVAPHREALSQNASFILTGVFAVIGWRLMSGVQALLNKFEPESPLDAKRFNEQVKLLATMLNTVAAAAVSVLAISEIAKHPDNPDMVVITIATGVGLWVHMGARGLLLHLKEDSPTAFDKPI